MKAANHISNLHFSPLHQSGFLLVVVKLLDMSDLSERQITAQYAAHQFSGRNFSRVSAAFLKSLIRSTLVFYLQENTDSLYCKKIHFRKSVIGKQREEKFQIFTLQAVHIVSSQTKPVCEDREKETIL